MGATLTTIGFVGGGQMAEAMVRGILAAGLTAAQQITVAEPVAARCEYLTSQYGVVCTQDPAALCRASEVVVLAVKPQLAAAVLAPYRSLVGERHLVLSIMAGITLRTLADAFDVPVRLIRVMPNTPALVLAAAIAFSPNAQATARDREIATALFSAVGTCVEVAEHLLDAVTGLSGSGPGYVFAFIEAMIDAGVLAGLPRPIAEQLTVQTVLGSARLAQESGEHPAVLKGRVTSPGGTTIAGLHMLEKGALRGLIMDAVAAATERSRVLGG
ncbi:pyrroline-5-carboxylate reductase [Desulfobulbus elongatus]|uniref:pyrroline-5-carboxylate reductase n=1 Tax=Desulfobulbus elongatus TaxID=53332 RepID=UPI000482F79C|nr:pyrroline-5-carboxylate reductase [Desulfobulbus elongatus]